MPTICVKQGLSNAIAESVLAARDGSLWIGTVDGLNRWDNGRIPIYRDHSEPAATALIDLGITTMLAAPSMDAAVRSVLGTAAGLFLLAGLWTPVVGTIVGATEAWAALARTGDPWHISS